MSAVLATALRLDGDDVAAALRSGIHSVVAQQDTLNRINVFPVADGDTGTNLTLSLGAALTPLNLPGDKHLGSLLMSVADTLLDNARGNSGAIVAQFFQGMSDCAQDLSGFTTGTFARAVSLGSEYAHDALSQPREGTILSVIGVFAERLRQQTADGAEQEFASVLLPAHGAMVAALAKTEQQLEVLRRAGVVDAGAKGFVALVEGMVQFIVHGRITEKPDIVDRIIDAAESTAGGEVESTYRYCTECVVVGGDIDRRKLREGLNELGDSLVLAGTKRKAKIHVHADDPEAVFRVARSFGEVTGEKADDMRRQQHSAHETREAFAVITDSAADIADSDMDRLDIHMVPVRVQFGDRGYLDKVSISTDEFFAELDSNPQHPTTSQPAPGDFRRQYQFLASHFPDVISINLTAAVSGTLQAAESAAARIDAPGSVHVVDSLNASTGQGLVAIYAAECAEAGLDPETALDAIRAIIPETFTFALIGDLRYAVRGGRVPALTKVLADALQITPVLRTEPDGRVSSSGVIFGRNNRLPKFARYIAKRVRVNSTARLSVGHALCESEALELLKLLQDSFGAEVTGSVTDIGSAFGVHGGRGTLVVALQNYRDPRSFAPG